MRTCPQYGSPTVLYDVDGNPVEIADVHIVDSLGNIIDDFGGATSATPYKKLYDRDATGNLLFEGWAAPGSTTASAVWRIKKQTFDAQNNIITEAWADGNSNFDNVYDNRASLTYS